MYLQVLKNIMIRKRYRQADIARMAGVSRAAVCKWFKAKDGICNIEMRTLLTLAKGLDVQPTLLLKKDPDISEFETRFLWDHLYPDMFSFVAAISRNRLPALARLTQVVGLNAAQKVAGSPALTFFPRYKKYIKPPRRKILEELWPLYQSKK